MTDYTKQEEELDARMDMIARNGNTGQHYDSAPPAGLAKQRGIQGEVTNPPHYALLGDIEAKHVIASAMTKKQWEGYCLGNILKYRLRAGNKAGAHSCLAKADEYKNIYEELRHLCKED